MPWAKGQSGNPGGRPKEMAEVLKLARDNGETAIKALVKVATDGKSESARVAAAVALLDRGFGKPPQFSTSDAEAFRRATDMSDDELADIALGGGEGAADETVDPSQLN